MLSPTTCSPDTAILWGTLPQFVQDQDTANGYPFLTWLEGGGSLLQATDSLSRDSDGYAGWSGILDINRCPTADLAWLAQFVGVRFTSLQQTDAAQRAAITGEQGFGRGTLAALEAVIAPFVTSFVITERSSDAYGVHLSAVLAGFVRYYELDATYTDYTALDAAFSNYNGTTSGPEPLIAAVTNALPAGLVLTTSFV
jgi:hypothetical protein